MFKYIMPKAVPLLFAAMFATAACADRDEELDRDLGLVGDTARGTVDLSDEEYSRTGGTAAGTRTGTATPPRTSTGTGKTSGSGTSKSVARTGTISTGSTIGLASNSRVCTNTHKVGDTFTAVVKESVTGSNGALIPAGSVATVKITSLSRKENIRDRVDMGFVVQSIRVEGRSYAVNSRITAVQVDQSRSPGNKDAQKVIGGAVAGAIIGQVIGKDTKSTVIGAATGAVAGTAVAMAAGEYEGCIPSGGNITIALNAPLVLTL